MPPNMADLSHIRLDSPSFKFLAERRLQYRPEDTASLIAAAVAADQYCGLGDGLWWRDERGFGWIARQGGFLGGGEVGVHVM